MEAVLTGIIIFLALVGVGFLYMASETGRYWNERNK